jgi:heme A synthase
MAKNTESSKSYQWLAWGTIGYTLLVIMFGAFVRATGSGAGCGEHWPLCNGQVIPRPEQIETIIEFTHRITSGLLLVMVLVGVIWAYKKFPKGHALRHGATLSLIFVLIEAAIGAGLVLLQLVEQNSTPLRAVAIGAHLVNTFLLIGVMTYTAWYASRGYSERFRIRAQGKMVIMIIAGLALYGLVGATGAITALGDTLFPIGSLAVEGAATHFLVELRIVHPILAVAVSFFIIWLAGYIRSQGALPHVNRTSYWLQIGVITQLIGGVANILLLAPTWMQLVHLLVADVVMILFVIVSMESLSFAPLYQPKRKKKQPAAIGLRTSLQ